MLKIKAVIMSVLIAVLITGIPFLADRLLATQSVFLYLLVPGSTVAFFLIGGHVHELSFLILSIVVDIVFYTIIVYFIIWLWNRNLPQAPTAQ